MFEANLDAEQRMVERLTDAENLVLELERKVERLEAITDATFDAGVRKGIKAAANKIEGLMAPDDWSKAEADAAYRFSYILAERLRATAHDKPESDTTTHRDGGDTKETT